MANIGSKSLKAGEARTFIGPIYIKGMQGRVSNVDYKKMSAYDYDNDGVVDYNEIGMDNNSVQGNEITNLENEIKKLEDRSNEINEELNNLKKEREDIVARQKVRNEKERENIVARQKIRNELDEGTILQAQKNGLDSKIHERLKELEEIYKKKQELVTEINKRKYLSLSKGLQEEELRELLKLATYASWLFDPTKMDYKRWNGYEWNYDNNGYDSYKDLMDAMKEKGISKEDIDASLPNGEKIDWSKVETALSKGLTNLDIILSFEYKGYGAVNAFYVDQTAKDFLDRITYMSEDEIKEAYDIYTNQDSKRLKEYLASKNDELNQKEGMIKALQFLSSVDLEDPNYQDYINAHFKGLEDGLDQFAHGMEVFLSPMNELSKDVTSDQYEAMYIATILGQSNSNVDVLFKDFNGLQKVYTLSMGAGNMLPSMMVGTLGSVFGLGELGAFSMFCSVTGTSAESSYQKGNDLYKSWFYGCLSGASEATLERVLGGISGISKISDKSFLLKMLSEGIEEAIQEILDPYLNYVTTGEEPVINWENVWEAGIDGAILAAYLNGGEVVIGNTTVGQEAINFLAENYQHFKKNPKNINEIQELMKLITNKKLTMQECNQIIKLEERGIKIDYDKLTDDNYINELNSKFSDIETSGDTKSKDINSSKNKVNFINRIGRQTLTVERNRTKKESLNEFSLYNTSFFKDIENSNIPAKTYNSFVKLIESHEGQVHISKEVGEELDHIITSNYTVGIHRSYAGIDFSNHEGNLLDNFSVMSVINKGIFATAHSGQGVQTNGYPSPSTNFSVFSGLSGWINLISKYKGNDVIYLYKYPEGTVTNDSLALLDEENKSGLFTIVDGKLTYSKENIMKVITKDSDGYFKMYDAKFLRESYESSRKQTQYKELENSGIEGDYPRIADNNYIESLQEIKYDISKANLEDVKNILDHYNQRSIKVNGMNYHINPLDAACLNARYKELTGQDHPTFINEQGKVLDEIIKSGEGISVDGKPTIYQLLKDNKISIENSDSILNRMSEIMNNIQGSNLEEISSLLNYYNGGPVLINGVIHQPFNDPISAAKLNARYKELTGKNHPIFNEQVPKVIDQIMLYKDTLIQSGAYNDSYFDRLGEIQEEIKQVENENRIKHTLEAIKNNKIDSIEQNSTELYNSETMPLSMDPEIRILQEKQLRGEKLTLKEVMFLDKKGMGGRDHTITKIGDYECKPDHCYRCISENTLEIYKENGFIIDDRRVDYVEGQNNQGIDWYLGGAMPGRYGNIIIECPADKSFFKPTRDGGYGMSNDIHVRHMKSSPKANPIPFSMITNVFDFNNLNAQNENGYK